MIPHTSRPVAHVISRAIGTGASEPSKEFLFFSECSKTFNHRYY